MKEKIKITSKGFLNNKNYGSYKFDNDLKKNIIYDKDLDQFCINGQWEIPYHKFENKK